MTIIIPLAEDEITYFVWYGSGNAGVLVLELGDNISVVWIASMPNPPMMRMPEGESQDKCSIRGTPSWWLVSHWPVKVEQVVQVSTAHPPHSVSPVAECQVRPGAGRSGMVQVLPSSRITSADSSAPVPPVTKTPGNGNYLIASIYWDTSFMEKLIDII